NLTNQIEKAAYDIIEGGMAGGGMVKAIEEGRIQKMIADRAYEYERESQSGERVIVGRNKYKTDEGARDIKLHESDPAQLERQQKRLAGTKAKRDSRKTIDKLAALKAAARSGDNLVPFVIDAVKEYATIGEITGTLKEVFGEFNEPITLG
ncbi:MAG: methylmalonyl-CoA mutase family protein, partial [bacterium]